MASIYLHIPFCKQACHYCNFHFVTSLRYKEELIAAMRQEISLQAPLLQGQEIGTVYFGGGTPSLLSAAECKALLQTIRDHFLIAPGAEITLEANPDDITLEKLLHWKASGINRLSIGVQSFFEEELVWMNRAHNAEQALASLRLATTHFDNITIDLIYGSPLLSDAMWQQNLETAIALGIPHLSCYALTVEEKTPLHKHINAKKKAPVDGNKQAHQFLFGMKTLRDAGYEHYEVSNFAKPGYRSRHNSAYWQGIHYLGIGPSAHSYNGTSRLWNVAHNKQYVAGIEAGQPLRETETLSPGDKLNEYIMISLRTREGLDLDRVASEWGEVARGQIEKGLERRLADGQAIRHGTSVSLTDDGMLAADGIAASLFTISPNNK